MTIDQYEARLAEGRAERLAEERAADEAMFAAASVTPIQTGDNCHSCNRPRKGTGPCQFCGDDTRGNW